MKILFIAPYPNGQAPSQRFRFEQYLEFLIEKGFKYDFAPFLDSNTWQILYKPGRTFAKAFGIIKGFLRRFVLMFSIYKYDYVFIHREASPIGPPIFEFVIAYIFNKKIIYDFDDAIWIPNTSGNNKIAASLKWHSKVDSICQWAFKVSCGNAYLCSYANQFNANVVLIPTTIDTEKMHNPNFWTKLENRIPVIGWTGTHSTLTYLDPLVPILKRLENLYLFEFCVIANYNPLFSLKSFKFVPWRKESEMQDLARFDVGLMPLTDDKWAKGKCGFKALQYMALEVPALVSPVGVNSEIVDNNINGFVCTSSKEWENALIELLEDKTKRLRVGKEARKKVLLNYSVLSNKNQFLSLFN